MCNKRTFVKLDGHDVQGPTHLNQVAPFNLKFSTLSVHPLLVQFLKKKVSRHNTPDEKIGSILRWNAPVSPPLDGCSSLRGKACSGFTKPQIYLFFYTCLSKWTPREPDSTLMFQEGSGRSRLWPPPVTLCSNGNQSHWRRWCTENRAPTPTPVPLTPVVGVLLYPAPFLAV